MKNLAEIIDSNRYDNLEFVAREVVEGFITGMHRSPFHGFSVEFAEHRLYNTGESTRHIDWKLFARSEKLFVKRYEEETNLRAQLVIDTSPSMLFPADNSLPLHKLAFSAFCSAALIHLLRKQRDAAGITFIGEKIELHTPARLTLSHQKLLYQHLSQLITRQFKQNRQPVTTSLTENLHQLAETMHKRSLVVIFSDMIETADPENLMGALEHMRYNKHEVILFYVTDPQHETFLQYPNRPMRFIDMENGHEIKLNPNQVRNYLREKSLEFAADLKLRCGQNRIDFVEADISRNFHEVLLPFLVKRQKLY